MCKCRVGSGKNRNQNFYLFLSQGKQCFRHEGSRETEMSTAFKSTAFDG